MALSQTHNTEQETEAQRNDLQRSHSQAVVEAGATFRSSGFRAAHTVAAITLPASASGLWVLEGRSLMIYADFGENYVEKSFVISNL